jgi:hypothetical protein
MLIKNIFHLILIINISAYCDDKHYRGILDYLIDVAKDNISGNAIMNKFGTNSTITTSTDPETVWSGDGLYSFFPDTAQAMEVISDSVADRGGLRSSGTATGGSKVTLVDNTADFVADNVVVGDLLINDTKCEYAVVTAVSATTILLNHTPMNNGSQVQPQGIGNEAGDAYRIVYSDSTGAAAIVVYGLDSNYLFQNEIVLLNGDTAVDLTFSYIRQYRSRVLIANSRAGAAGDIEVRISGGGTIACFIAAGQNQTQQAFFTIPGDKTGYFLHWYVSVGKGAGATAISARFTWRAIVFGGAKAVNGEIEILNTGAGYWKYRYDGAPILLPRTDIEIICEEVSATVGVQAGMDILLHDN